MEKKQEHRVKPLRNEVKVSIIIIRLHSVDSMASRGILLVPSCILRPCHFGRCHALQAPAAHEPLKPKGHTAGPCGGLVSDISWTKPKP